MQFCDHWYMNNFYSTMDLILGLQLRLIDHNLFWGIERSHRKPHLVSRPHGCCRQETCASPRLCEWVQCHVGQPNCHHTTVQGFPSNVLSQMPQNTTVVLGINSVTMGDESIVHSLANVKENHQHALSCTPNTQDCGLFHCENFCLCMFLHIITTGCLPHLRSVNRDLRWPIHTCSYKIHASSHITTSVSPKQIPLSA